MTCPSKALLDGTAYAVFSPGMSSENLESPGDHAIPQEMLE